MVSMTENDQTERYVVVATIMIAIEYGKETHGYMQT